MSLMMNSYISFITSQMELLIITAFISFKHHSP